MDFVLFLAAQARSQASFTQKQKQLPMPKTECYRSNVAI
jgi:hypothetical protein